MTTYGASEFIEKLSANDLPDNDPDNDAVAIAGLVKHDADDFLAFSTSLTCESWLAIPTSMVADITHLQNIKCKDHRHPPVTIRLKQPDPAQAELDFLFGLLSEVQRTVARLSRSKTTGGAGEGLLWASA